MNKTKYTKGEFKYPEYQTKIVIIRTIIYFVLSLAIFIMGYISTGTKANLLTVVAVFGCLPSCKSLVSVIMYLRIPKFSTEIYDSINNRNKEISILYSLYLTSYKENYALNCFAVRGNNIIGFSEFDGCNTTGCEEHVKELLKHNGMKTVTVKVFKDLKKFENRLEQISLLETGDKDAEAVELLCDISL